MKKKIYINDKIEEKIINYIPIRYILAILLAVIETSLVISIVVFLTIFIPYFFIAIIITELFVIVEISISDENPDFKIPWLIVVVFLPIIGFMVYFLFSKRKLKRKFIKKINKLNGIKYNNESELNLMNLKKIDLSAYNSANLLCKIAGTNLFNKNSIEYFSFGENYFERLLIDLKQAQKFIYMEYFIIEDGMFWSEIFNVLKEKAQRGLDVKILYDDIGCMTKLPGDYARQLKKYGIKCAIFSKLKGNADSEFNNRNHRKITIIDGIIGYTGGINIADEYINEIKKFGKWKDIGIRIKGDSVYELTKLFMIDFGINSKEKWDNYNLFFPKVEIKQNNEYVIPFGDGPKPIYKYYVGKVIIQNLIENAKKYVYITTPYLIIDNELCMTLENAALRGVKVKVIVPHIPDKKVIFQMTKGFYARLIQSGVEIYEYTPGFIHAKCYLADDKYCILGTINLDYRSLVHHFENGVWLYNCQVILNIKEDLEATLLESELIKIENVKTNIFKRIFNIFVKLFAPML